MVSPLKIHTVRRSLLISITGFILFLFILGMGLMISMFIDEENKILEKNTRSWAQLLSLASIKSIDNEDHDALHNSFKRMQAFDFINYVHIYRYKDSDSSLEFFTSYNKDTSFPAIPNKSSKVNELSEPRFNENNLEFITPIKSNGRLYGYVYIQTNNQNIKLFTRKITITALIFISISLLLSLLIIVRINQKITDPIKNLTRTIQHISQSKNYDSRCEQAPYQELDILTKNINILLTRTEKHIRKLNEAETQTTTMNQELKDKVSLRTDALKESNQELLSTLEKLHQFQDQLVESEKMASLGDMVAGVAHEVNTPIGLGVTASTLLSDRMAEIKHSFENKTLKSSQLKKFLNEGHENVGIIYRNLNRAANLISSFKKLAVDQSSEEDRKFNIKQLVNDIFLSIVPQLNKQPIVISLELHCPDDLVIISKPGPINQILINLIMNSILHAFDNREKGSIVITIMNISQQLNINYRDDGNGVDSSIKAKIFDPFITTKRGSGGSGLGLHLVYNLVTQALGGHLDFESEVHHGVTFDINFPITIVES